MLLSAMLLGADRRRRLWLETGGSFVVVDTLIHNYLHRTGVLRAARAEHPYGPHCYAANGGASIIQAAARDIDASVIELECKLSEVNNQGLPPEKWSSLMYGLWPDGGLKNAKEETHG